MTEHEGARSLARSLGGLGRHFGLLSEELDATGGALGGASAGADSAMVQRLDHISQTLGEAGRWLETLEADVYADNGTAPVLTAPYRPERALRLESLSRAISGGPDTQAGSDDAGEVDLF